MTIDANMMIPLLSGMSMPLIATVYSLARKPEWHESAKEPSWTALNIISLIIGSAFGLLAAAYELYTASKGSASVSIWTQAYIAQVFGTVGWAAYHFTVSDWKTTKINRHALRLLLVIQLATSLVYCFTVPGNGGWVFALITVLLTAVSLLVPLMAIPMKDRKTHRPVVKDGRKQYRKLIPMGMSDARGLALMMAACFPLLTNAFIFPILGFLLFGFALTVWFFTYSGVAGTKTNGKGGIEVVRKTSEGAQRILANKSDSLRKQSIPLGPAIAIPFAITMLIWLFM